MLANSLRTKDRKMSKMLTEHEILQMPESAYMNPAQLAFFNNLLLERGKTLQHTITELAESLKEITVSPDACDMASQEESRSKSLRLLDRANEELRQVRAALDRIQNDDYGFCDLSGEPIGIKRLMISPAARYDTESQRVIEARARTGGASQIAYA